MRYLNPRHKNPPNHWFAGAEKNMLFGLFTDERKEEHKKERARFPACRDARKQGMHRTLSFRCPFVFQTAEPLFAHPSTSFVHDAVIIPYRAEKRKP
ncbi:MAG: hypothetical protein IKN04_02690 [Clostridia bacterium]|nr:hypothetical protein [Clostridia bacterium]